MTGDTTREFLGWEGALLDRAADWLVARYGENMSSLLVALPGGRAGRKLLEKLARLQPASWCPPRVLTQGQLTDELVRWEAEPANRIVRTLAWESALRAIPPTDLNALMRVVPASEDAGAWHRLAEMLRTLHGQLAPEGLDFAAVAQRLTEQDRAGEARRWQTLARVQVEFHRILESMQLVDPHEARLRAIEAGDVGCDAEIALVGIADMNHLLRRALEVHSQGVCALVFAPKSEADSFDEWGCLRVDDWKDRNTPLTDENWIVTDKPADQAAAAIGWLAERGMNLVSGDVMIGAADEEVVPFLERQLAEVGVRARHAAGVVIEQTRPMRLLDALSRFAQTKSWKAWAALVRHPDLAAILEDLDAAAICDAHHDRHLPNRVDHDGKFEGDFAEVVQRARPRLASLLEAERRALPEWTAPMREFLLDVYAQTEFDREDDEQRAAAECLRLIESVLTEIAGLPAELHGILVTAGEAIAFVQGEVQAKFIAPSKAREGEPYIELLGWLELALDDAEWLAVTGFAEGCVPEAIGGDPFLPNRLRKSLGLADSEARQARDVHQMTLLCHSRQVVFVTGRRSVAGDPIVPSRLAFHCDPEETPARVLRCLGSEGSAREELPSGGGRDWSCPVRASHPPLESISVTAFRDYLQSPYLFYLRHVLRLKTLDDNARELDAGKFGSLAHEVLEAFGKSAAKDALDEKTIFEFLSAELQKVAARAHGSKPLPAIALQIQQLEYRLSLFATKQAEWAQKGWRIEEVEWESSAPYLLQVDGEPTVLRGRIDRIDRNTKTGEWAILDYKTSDKAKDPTKEHWVKRTETWKDLQLPLYCHLTASLQMEAVPQLGYVNLGSDEKEVRFWCITDWDDARIEDAKEEAERVIRAVRNGEFEELGRGRAYDDISQALMGVGLIEVEEDEA